MPDPNTTFWLSLFGMITLVTVAGSLGKAWTVAHRATLDAALKREMIQRGMSVEDLERVMAASAHPRSPSAEGISEDSLNEVVTVLGQVHATPAVIEEVLWAFRSVDVRTQELISQAIQHLVGDDTHKATGDQILAVVRPLCQPKVAANGHVAPVRDERITR